MTAAAAIVDLRALALNANLATKGKALFAQQCATCHGAEGKGDGEMGKGLNPPPRNYRTQEFKFGNDVVSIYNVLLRGSPGTSMASFAQLPPEDLFALAHYVRTLIPNPAPTTDEVLAKLPSSSTGSADAASAPAETGPRIPIRLAMERLAREPSPAAPGSALAASLPGAALYAERCAVCHGSLGEGRAQRVLAVAPYRYQVAPSLAASRQAWTHDRARFAEIVLKGIPGHSMPAQATLNSRQVDELYAFVRVLAAR